MKVVHVIESFGGGCLAFLETLTKHLANDHEQVVVHGLRKDTPKNVAELFRPSVRLVPFDLSLTANPFQTVTTIWRLVQLLKLENPDIVHCHSSLAGFYGRIAAKFSHNKTAYTPHAYAFLTWQRHRYLYFFAEYILSFIDATIIACGEEEFLLARKISKRRTTYLVKNGIDFSDIAKANEMPGKHNERLPCIVSFGRVVEPTQDLDLFNRLADKLEGRCRLVWIGAEKDDCRLAPHVERTGWLDRKKALSALRDADIVLHVTNYDGLSYAVLESMAMEKCLVAKDIPASRNVVEHGETGFLVNGFPDLERTVDRLLSEPALRAEVGKRARDMIEASYGADRMAREYASIYAEIVQGKAQ